jgi:hypothetical protein
MSETKTPAPKTPAKTSKTDKTPAPETSKYQQSPLDFNNIDEDYLNNSINSLNLYNSFNLNSSIESIKISLQISEAIVYFCGNNDEKIIKEKFKAENCIFQSQDEFNKLKSDDRDDKEEDDSNLKFSCEFVIGEDNSEINLDLNTRSDIADNDSQGLIRKYIGEIVFYDVDMNNIMKGIFPPEIDQEIQAISMYGKNKSENNKKYFQNICFRDNETAHAMLLLCTETEVFLYDSNGFATQQILDDGEKYEYDVSSFYLDENLNAVESDNSEYNESQEYINMDNHIQSDASCFNTDLTLTFLFFEFEGGIKECIQYLDQKNQDNKPPNLDMLASKLISVIEYGKYILPIEEGSLDELSSPSWIKLPNSTEKTQSTETPDSPSTETEKYRLRFF